MTGRCSGSSALRGGLTSMGALLGQAEAEAAVEAAAVLLGCRVLRRS